MTTQAAPPGGSGAGQAPEPPGFTSSLSLPSHPGGRSTPSASTAARWKGLNYLWGVCLSALIGLATPEQMDGLASPAPSPKPASGRGWQGRPTESSSAWAPSPLAGEQTRIQPPACFLHLSDRICRHAPCTGICLILLLDGSQRGTGGVRLWPGGSLAAVLLPHALLHLPLTLVQPRAGGSPQMARTQTRRNEPALPKASMPIWHPAASRAPSCRLSAVKGLPMSGRGTRKLPEPQ